MQILKTSDRITLPIEHTNLVSSLRKLPDTKIKLHTKPQRQWLAHRRGHWQTIAVLIDYRQAEDYGYRPILSSGFDVLHPKQQENFLVSANLYYSQLQLIISQFDYLENFALKQGRDFPFSNPRHLFAEILREIANSEFTEQVCSDHPQNHSLTDNRKSVNHHIKFWQKRLKDKQDEADFIKFSKTSLLWSDWWIYPVWKSWQETRTNPDPKFKYCFERHLEAMKNFKKLIETPNTDKEGVFLSCTHWQRGYPFDPKSKRRVSLQNVTY